MKSFNEQQMLILFLAVLAAFYFLTQRKKKEPIHNEGMLTHDTKISDNFNDIVDTGAEQQDNESNDTFESIDDILNDSVHEPVPDDDEEDDSEEELEDIKTNKMKAKISKHKNSASGDYKHASFGSGKRGSKSDVLDDFFESRYPMESSNDKYEPVVENEGAYAAYTPGKPKKLSSKDKFDPASLLPGKSNDFIDDPYEASSVTTKNQHLINIHRPIGLDTIQSSKKIGIRDIRGTIPNKKRNISPFLNSSYDHDGNINTQALCN
jgi:hypothetical protein